MDSDKLAVYFHIEDDVPYDDAVVYLAEGLQELGYACRASRDFGWTGVGNEPLVRRGELSSQRWAVAFIDYTAFRFDTIDNKGVYHRREKQPDIDSLTEYANMVVLIDLEDGYSNRCADDPRIRLIFRAKFNARCKQSSKSRPYVLGVQQRCLDLARRSEDSREGPMAILDSYGFTHPYDHVARTRFREEIIPLLAREGIAVKRRTAGSLTVPPEDPVSARWWHLTMGKHNPAYYELVRSYPMHSCICGDVIPAFPYDPSSILVGGNKARLRKVFYSTLTVLLGRRERLIQWDSWRFWETLALGVVPLMYDLDKFGVCLPVMPENWTHYVGIDPDNPSNSVKQLKRRWNDLPIIAAAGRKWMLEHYSPAANARRVMETIQGVGEKLTAVKYDCAPLEAKS